jgi:hypothetical protein
LVSVPRLYVEKMLRRRTRMVRPIATLLKERCFFTGSMVIRKKTM